MKSSKVEQFLRKVPLTPLQVSPLACGWTLSIMHLSARKICWGTFSQSTRGWKCKKTEAFKSTSSTLQSKRLRLSKALQALCKVFLALKIFVVSLYTVFASLANILPKSNYQPLPASLPKSPHFTRKRCTAEGLRRISLPFFHKLKASTKKAM